MDFQLDELSAVMRAHRVRSDDALLARAVAAFAMRHTAILSVGFGIVILCLGLWTSWGQRKDVCNRCGAVSKARYFRFVDSEVCFWRSPEKGAVAEWISRREGKACLHVWRAYTVRSYGLWGGSADGIGTSFSLYQALLLFNNDPITGRVFDEMQSRDPGFLDKLLAAIRDCPSRSTDAFFAKVFDDPRWHVKDEKAGKVR